MRHVYVILIRQHMLIKKFFGAFVMKANKLYDKINPLINCIHQITNTIHIRCIKNDKRIANKSQNRNLKSRWKFLVSMCCCLIGKKNISTTSLKNLYIGFRATLTLCKNDVSLKPTYRLFSNLAHLFIIFVRQKYIKLKKFHRPVFEL